MILFYGRTTRKPPPPPHWIYLCWTVGEGAVAAHTETRGCGGQNNSSNIFNALSASVRTQLGSFWGAGPRRHRQVALVAQPYERLHEEELNKLEKVHLE